MAAVWLAAAGRARTNRASEHNPLGPHRVSLVGHRRGADLLGLERLFELAFVRQQPQIGAEAMGTLGEPRQGADDLGIDLARIGLARDRVGPLEAERGGDHAIEGLDLGIVAVEEGQEAGLGAGGPLHAQEPELGARRSISARSRISSWHQSVARLPTVTSWAGWKWVYPRQGRSFHRTAKIGEGVDRRDELIADQVQGLSDQDQVGVVGDVATGRPQMDDRAGHGRRVAQRMDMGHHVVAEPPLVGFGGGEVDRLDLGAERVDLLVADVQPQRALGLGQRDPEPTPGGELDLGRPEPGHPPAGVAGDQGIVVNFVITHQRMFADLSFSFDIQEDCRPFPRCGFEKLLGRQIPPRAWARLTRVMARMKAAVRIEICLRSARS